MGKVKILNVMVLVAGVIFFIIGMSSLFNMARFSSVRDFSTIKTVSIGISFTLNGGFLLVISLMIKWIINKASQDTQDLRNEIHLLRKEIENLKKD